MTKKSTGKSDRPATDTSAESTARTPEMRNLESRCTTCGSCLFHTGSSYTGIAFKEIEISKSLGQQHFERALLDDNLGSLCLACWIIKTIGYHLLDSGSQIW